jgi:hypothetical protein
MDVRTGRVLGSLLGCLLTATGCSSDDDSGGGSAGGAGRGSVTGGSGGSSGTGGIGGSAGGATATGGGAGAGAGRSQATGGSAGGGGAGGRGGQAGKGAGGSAGSGAGAPPSAWVNVTSNLANLPSECGNLTLVSATPGSSTVIAGVAKVGLYATTDGGAHWDALGTGAGSAVITNRPSSIVYDPEHPGTFWESGIYNGGGVYRTTDDGETFEQLGDIGHNDLVSVDFGDPERKTLLVGGHEQKQTLYLSRDGGQTFDQIGKSLPADSHFSSAPLVLDAQTFLVGSCGYGDGACGVYRSEDGGDTWARASDLAVVARPLWASDDSIYWPLIYDGGVAHGLDAGKVWSQAGQGLVSWYPVELPDGRVLTLGGDHVVVSADQGMTWTPVGETLPFKASGVTYSVQTKTLFIWHWDCGSVVLSDAIAAAGFDYASE